MEKDFIIRKMKKLAQSISYNQTDISYLKKAMYRQLIHNDSDDGKNRKNYTNDSIATLGDAILKFILTEYWFNKDFDKFQITKKKEVLEKNETLFKLCDDNGIFEYAYNDDNFFNDAPQDNKVPHSKHDPYIEAIIGAIYLDRGINYCRQWIIEFYKNNNLLLD